jgi:uncharacterized repeat protein (TIGR03803 family)
VLYGTATVGGSGARGRIFRINKDGTGYAAVRDFTGNEDGQAPRAGLIAASDGLLYGTTTIGGSNGFGTAFGIAPDGSGYRVLHHFTGATTDGTTPKGNLLEGPDGLLYGMATQGGGGTGAKGVLFGVSKDGAIYRTLWQFAGLPLDGQTPVGGLALATDGSLVGCTEAGGAFGFGTIFRADPTLVALTIQQHGAMAAVRWPISSTSDQLEEASNIDERLIPWTKLNSATSTNGNQYEVALPIAPGNRFLRVTRNWK